MGFSVDTEKVAVDGVLTLQDSVHHPTQCAFGSQDGQGAITPPLTQLGEGLAGLFAFAGVEVGLLHEPVHGAFGWHVSVLVAVGAQQLVVAGLDGGAAAGELFTQLGQHPGDLDDRLAAVAHLADLTAHTELAADQVHHCAVVALRVRHGGLVQGFGVDGSPHTVGALDLLGHRGVGVKVRIPGPGIVVIELGHDQPFGVDLQLTAGTGASKNRFLLQVREGVVDRLVVAAFDGAARLFITQGPQRGHRFGGSEHQVEPGNGLAHFAFLEGNPRRQFPLGQRGAALVGGEQSAAVVAFDVADLGHFRAAVVGGHERFDARFGGFHQLDVVVVVRELAAQPGGLDRRRRLHTLADHRVDQSIRVGVQRFSEQRFHLLFADRAVDRQSVMSDTAGQALVLEREKPIAPPQPRGSAMGGVVIGHLLAPLALAILTGHLVRQIAVAVTGMQHVQGHHHRTITRPRPWWKKRAAPKIRRSARGVSELITHSKAVGSNKQVMTEAWHKAMVRRTEIRNRAQSRQRRQTGRKDGARPPGAGNTGIRPPGDNGLPEPPNGRVSG